MTNIFIEELLQDLKEIKLISEIQELYKSTFQHNLLLTYYLLKYFGSFKEDVFSKISNFESEINIKVAENKDLSSKEREIYEICLLQKKEFLKAYMFSPNSFNSNPNIYFIVSLLLALLEVFHNNRTIDNSYFQDIFLKQILGLLIDFDKNQIKIKQLFIQLFLEYDFKNFRSGSYIRELERFSFFYKGMFNTLKTNLYSIFLDHLIKQLKKDNKPNNHKLIEKLELFKSKKITEEIMNKIRELVDKYLSTNDEKYLLLVDELFERIDGGKIKIKKVVRKY